MSLEVHSKAIFKILEQKSYNHLSIAHITNILAALPSILTSKSPNSDLINALESVLLESKP